MASYLQNFTTLPTSSSIAIENDTTLTQINEVNNLFKYGTDNPFYNYEYSEEVGLYYIYQGNRDIFYVYLIGSVISYIALIFNMSTFFLLFISIVDSKPTTNNSIILYKFFSPDFKVYISLFVLGYC